MTLARFHIPGPLLLLALFVACDRHHPLAPGIEAAAGGQAGPTVPAPSNTNAVAASKSRIDVSWRDNSTNETGFELDRSTTGPGGAFTPLTTTGANVTTSSDVGLAALTQYCYKVRAFKTTGTGKSYSDFSNTACATTPGPPPAPSRTDAIPSSSSTVGITWVDNSGTEDGFRVERSASSAGPWALVVATGPNVTSYNDGARASEQQVCYRVTAFNGSGGSPPSNADCTTPPAAPTGLTATAEADQPAIDLAWTDNSAVEDGYEVLRDDAGVVADLPANTTTYRDAAVGSNTRYSYHVRAKKDGGFSDFSDVASAECVAKDCPTTCNGNFDCGLGLICGPEHVCVPHCGDGVKNGGESDVDCGGDECVARCATGQTCSVPGDCASGICSYGVCQ